MCYEPTDTSTNLPTDRDSDSLSHVARDKKEIFQPVLCHDGNHKNPRGETRFRAFVVDLQWIAMDAIISTLKPQEPRHRYIRIYGNIHRHAIFIFFSGVGVGGKG